MKFSARNVFRGKVKAVKKGPVNSEIIIELPGGFEVVSTVTSASAESMELKEGADVIALVKATQVMLVTTE